MHDLPRQLSVDELAELFEGRTRFVERLARRAPTRSSARRTLVHELSPRGEEAEVLDAHPAIGAREGSRRARRRSRAPTTSRRCSTELARLNADYEARHGFRFVVFVNRRPKAEILEVLRSRIERTTRARSSRRRSASSSRSRRTDGGAADRSLRRTTGSTSSSAGSTSSRRSSGSERRSTSSRSTTTCCRRRTKPTASAASAARRGRSTAAASTASRSSGSRRDALPEPLHWFKWEAYRTWLSGFALLRRPLLPPADTYLIDPAVADSRRGGRSRVELALLAVAWLVYDVLCRRSAA